MSIKKRSKIRKKFKFYLAGPISHAKGDTFISWRSTLERIILSLGHTPLNPVKKFRVPTKEKTVCLKMVRTEKCDVAREFIRRRIITPDLELCEQADACIAYVPFYSVGTSSEIFYFYFHKKPVYVVTPLPREKWSGWLVGLSTLIFTSWEDLVKFLSKLEIVE